MSSDIKVLNVEDSLTLNGIDVETTLNEKVDKVVGKELSTNDYTNNEKTNLDINHNFINHIAMSGVVNGGNITLTGGIGFDISAGSGFIRNATNNIVPINWSGVSTVVPTAGDNFIYIDYNGNVVFRTIKSDLDNIFIGYITTNVDNTAIMGFNSNKFLYSQYLSRLNKFIENTVGTIIEYGFDLSVNSVPNTLKVTSSAGALWNDFNEINVGQLTDFRKFYRDNLGVDYEDTSTPNFINNTQYNDKSISGTNALVSMTPGYYKKDLFFITTRGMLYYQHGTSQYSEVEYAYSAEPPIVNPASTNVVVIAHIIIQEGNSVPIAVIDMRPNFTRLWDGHYFKDLIPTIEHHSIQGLLDDDHTQYHTDARGDARYYTKTELDAGQLNTLYYTESEINTLLLGKANSSHTHVSADITDLSPTTVGLGNVPNTDATNANNISTGTLANARLSTNLNQIGNITTVNGDIISVVGGVYTARTISQYKSDLALNNVANVDTTNASNISSGTLADARLSMNLSQLGGITFATNDFIQYNGSTLVNVTPASVKTSLSLTKSDVGLGNVTNVDTTDATNISTGTLANARLSTNLNQIGNITFATNDFMQFDGAIVTNITPVALKSSLSLTKSDVGLGNVQNVDQTNASNISSGTLANNRLTTNLAQIGGITFATNDLIYYNGSTLTNITPSGYKALLSLTKSDVGLGNVVNSLQVINAGNGTSLASGNTASRPTAGTNGSVYASTDNGLFLDNGSSWVLQQAAITGDISISVNSTTATLATVNSNIGTFNNVTVNAKGLVTAASNIAYITGNQTITVTGDATGSGTTSLSLALATVNSNVGTFGSTTVVPVVTVNGKGLVTAVSTAALTNASVGLGNVANSLQVINTGNVVSIASGLNSVKPVAGTVNRFYASTDIGVVYRDNGTTWDAQLPAYTGDVSSTFGNTTLTLATVNSNVGTFNNVTVNGKGLVTAASNVSYLTGNQSITLSGDFSGTGTTSISGTLATVNSNVGTFNNVTVNGKGLVTAASNISYLTGNESITLSGDFSGTGTTSISGTLATVNSNVGTFGSTTVVPVVTVNGKGLVTAVSTAALTNASVGLGNVANSLQVINTGNVVSIASGLDSAKPVAGTLGRYYNSTDIGGIYRDNGVAWQLQSIAYTGDVTSSVNGTVLTLATVNSNVGTFNNVTVNGKGLVTAASNVAYITGNQTITVSGDITGSGTTSIGLTLATVNSNVGTFGSTTVVPVITTNAKGLITAVSSANLTNASVGLGNVSNNLQVINAGNGVSFASGTLAARPVAATNGRLYATTNDGIYLDNGASWILQSPAYTGDVTKSANATALTLATVNSNIGTFNNVTINAKGLATSASNVDYLLDPAANGIVVRTAINTTTNRTLTGTANQTSITNGDGVAGNPTIAIASNPVLPGTASTTIPIGTTAERDTATNGQLRFNSTLGYTETSSGNVYHALGKVIQFISGDIIQTTGTTILPYDNTLPTSTEGFQIWTANITPTYTTSTIVIIFNVYAECSSVTATTTLALYNGTTAISIAAGRGVNINTAMDLSISKRFVSGTISPITLSARIGPSAAASTVYVNKGNAETFGGTTNSSYIIMEII